MMRLLRTTLLCLLLVLLPAGARAQDEERGPLRLRIQPIYGPYIIEGAWIPIAVDVQNTGDTDWNGTLRVHTRTADLARERKLDLGRGTTKRLFFASPPVTWTDARHEVVVTLLRNDRSVLRQSLDLDSPFFRRRPAETTVVGLVGEVRTTPARTLQIRLKPGLWPRTPEGLAALDAIVIGPGRTSTIDEESISALKTWVSDGGRLILLAHAPRLLPPSLRSLAPGNVTSSRTVDHLEEAHPKKVGMSGFRENWLLHRVAPGKGSRVLLETDTGDPLLVARQVGWGAVLHVPFRPQVAMENPGALWTLLVRPEPSSDSEKDYRWSFLDTIQGGDGRGLAEWAPPIELISFGLILVLGLLYILLASVGDFFFHWRRGKLEQTWWTFTLLAVGTTTLVILYSLFLRESHEQQNRLTIVDVGPGSSIASGTTFLGFHAESSQRYTVRLPAESQIVPDPANANDLGTPLLQKTESEQLYGPVFIPVNYGHVHAVEWHVPDFGTIAVDHPAPRKLRIENQTPFALQNVRLVLWNGAFVKGPARLARGASNTFSLRFRDHRGPKLSTYRPFGSRFGAQPSRAEIRKRFRQLVTETTWKEKVRKQTVSSIRRMQKRAPDPGPSDTEFGYLFAELTTSPVDIRIAGKEPDLEVVLLRAPIRLEE